MDRLAQFMRIVKATHYWDRRNKHTCSVDQRLMIFGFKQCKVCIAQGRLYE